MKIIKEDWKSYLKVLENRACHSEVIVETVERIIQRVKKEGDAALFDYTSVFDGSELKTLRVTSEEIDTAFDRIDGKLLSALEHAMKSIEDFHHMQIRKSQFIKTKTYTVGELIKPLKNVGIYVPGGKASYPSTVLMNAIPAKLAGVKRLVMVTPPDQNGTIRDAVLVAAKLTGVDEIYKIGGAQAIAALAYGSESIKCVDKIVGPGNAYVALAKKQVSTHVGIDMIAGPSEVLILADKDSNPAFIAADLIAQAEHDEQAAAIVLTSSLNSIEVILEELALQIRQNPRKKIIDASLEANGAIIYMPDPMSMIELTNLIAPEHLEIMRNDALEIIEFIDAAGAIFIGDYSPEALGDYFAGPNHTLPTSGTARFSSPLSVDDFIKKTSYIHYSKNALKAVSDTIITIAEDESLYGHANSIRIRKEQ